MKPMSMRPNYGKTDRAILALNLGGPQSLDDVKPFLFRLFEDPEVLRIRWAPLRRFVAWLITTLRAKSSQSMYAKIGGGSPIRKLTDEQAVALQQLLRNEAHPATVHTAFTCSEPLVEDVVRDLASAGVRKFLAFPLYPQYSLTTTKGSLDRTRRAVARFAPAAELEEIQSWPDHPLFLQAHAELIRETMKHFHVHDKDTEIHLVFSAHSIPEKLVTAEGDPYKSEMEKTVAGVIAASQWKGPWTLAWQSKLGPMKWLGPATMDVILHLARSGCRRVLVVPIAFVTDHIETLFEIDQMIRDAAMKAGIEEFYRTPGLNTHPTFIRALADIAKSRSRFWA